MQIDYMHTKTILLNKTISVSINKWNQRDWIAKVFNSVPEKKHLKFWDFNGKTD